MDLYKIIAVIVFTLMLKVGALSSEGRTQTGDILLLADTHKSFANLKDLYSSAKTTWTKLQSCGTGTQLQILAVTAEKLGDIQACVNATRELANYEDFLLHTYYFSKFVASTVIELIEDVLGCRHQYGFFTILNCTVAEVQASGAEFDQILSRAEGLIAEVQNDTNNLVYYVKQCFRRSSSELFSELYTIINKC